MYSKANPSPRYLELTEQYRQLHEEGAELVSGKTIDAERIYANAEYAKEAKTIRNQVDRNRITSLINFGAATPETWYNQKVKIAVGDEEITVGSMAGLLSDVDCTLYDPGVEAISEYPTPKEMVICTDVLEHIPVEDLDWFMDELGRLATKHVHVSVHMGPAFTILPNGWNAHVTVRPREWWIKFFARFLQRMKDEGKNIGMSVVYRTPIDPKSGEILNIDYSEYGYNPEKEHDNATA